MPDSHMMDKGKLPVSLAEMKAHLRLSQSEDDALVTGLVRTASALCEAFLGEALMQRACTAILPVSSAWQKLPLVPVQMIEGVQGLPAEGAAFALAADAYAMDIDADGTGWIRVLRPGSAGRVRASYVAGRAAAQADLPETVRHGIIRLVEHLYHENGAQAHGAVPAAVTALWQPHRRMRLC